jgi:FkbM family methyltransferase
MAEATVLSLIDGVRVVVPDSLDLITPYVLREQLDFFEDELPFVRRLLQSGHKVIDIGANYGVYTLPMARKVGATGHVWAFEPTSSTAGFLVRGIAENGFEQVTFVQAAVSSASGSARLILERHSEANAIAHGDSPVAASEVVSIVSLDECMDRYQWSEIEFMKIDAEGEESNILKGGHRFFSQLAPLVQYELKKGDDFNLQLIEQFAALGYQAYRLVPALDVLVPLRVDAMPDPYLLNAFGCTGGRADILTSRGLLLRPADVSSVGVVTGPRSTDSETMDRYRWQSALAHLPYAAAFRQRWQETETAGINADVVRALSLYSRSRDPDAPLVERFQALEASFSALKALCGREPTRLRLVSLARVAHDLGERAASVNALTSLLAHIHKEGVDVSEPFLPPMERFDSIVPDADPARWLVAGVLEQLERRERFSSFYAGPNARERLEDIHALGLGSPEMARRLELVRERFSRRPTSNR